MKIHRQIFSLMLPVLLLPVNTIEAQDLTGFCLDLGEGGCTGRYLPFEGLTIGFCEESCTLNNPVPVNGLDAMLYDMTCGSDNPGTSDGRVMILRQVDRRSNNLRTSMIDASRI